MSEKPGRPEVVVTEQVTKRPLRLRVQDVPAEALQHGWEHFDIVFVKLRRELLKLLEKQIHLTRQEERTWGSPSEEIKSVQSAIRYQAEQLRRRRRARCEK